MHAQSDEKPGEVIIDPKDAWLYNRETAFYQSDEWMVHYQKILICPQKNPHSWVDCPFAHKGERAKRRDLRTHCYSSDPCDSAKKNLPCPKGDACDKSHHVYESWLHPELYRTRMCAAGARCVRRVCFFAHSQLQLRRTNKASSSCSAAEGQAPQPQQQQQQQQQDGTGGELVGEAASSQDAEFTALVEPWPESWGFGAAAAAAAAAIAQDAQAEGQAQQRQQQQQQRVSNGSADVATSSKDGHRSTTAAASGCSRAATPTSGSVSVELAMLQQQRQQQLQQPGTLHTATPGTSAGLSMLQSQQQYVQQQQQQRRNSNISSQGSGGEACLPFAGMLANNCSPVLMQQQQRQQYAATPSPDVASAAAAAVGSPTGLWSPCSTYNSSNSSSRQLVGCAAQQLSPSLVAAAAAAAAAAHPSCSSSSSSSSICHHQMLRQQELQVQQAIDACRGGTGQQPADRTAAAAAAGLLHGRGTFAGHHEFGSRLHHSRPHLPQPPPPQQQQQQRLLIGASSSSPHPVLPLGSTATVTAAAAEAALAALELHPKAKAAASADASAAAAAAAAAAVARDALVQSLAAANAAAAAHELAQLQLLSHSNNSNLHGLQFSSDHLGPGWGLIHGAGPGLSRYGSGVHSSGSGISSAASGMARSSCDYAGSGSGLTAPGWALTASGLTTSSSGLAAPGWGAAVSGLGRSGSSGLTAPGWGAALSGLAESGPSGLTGAGQGVAAPGWGFLATGPSGPGHLAPGNEVQPTALAQGHQQPHADPQHTSFSQALDPFAALHALQQGVSPQAGSMNVVAQQLSALQRVPELLPCTGAPYVQVTGPGAAYHRHLNAAPTAAHYHTNAQLLTSAAEALALQQQMLDAAVRAQGAAAAAAAGAAGTAGLLSSQYTGNGSRGLQDSSRQACWQVQQDRWNQQ